MKLIIAGSRHFDISYKEIVNYLDFFKIHPYTIDQVVSGHYGGVDLAGEEMADIYISDHEEHIKLFEADWDKYGGRAGPIRNRKMAVYADALLLIWDGSSYGSASMKEAMLALGKPVYEVMMRKYDSK